MKYYIWREGELIITEQLDLKPRNILYYQATVVKGPNRLYVRKEGIGRGGLVYMSIDDVPKEFRAQLLVLGLSPV